MSQNFTPAGRALGVCGPLSDAGCQPSLGTHGSPIAAGATRASPRAPPPAPPVGVDPPDPLTPDSSVGCPPDPPRETTPESTCEGTPPFADAPVDEATPPRRG